MFEMAVLTLNDLCISESGIEIKISWIFVFTLLFTPKGFVKALKAFIKPFRGTTKKYENKNLT